MMASMAQIQEIVKEAERKIAEICNGEGGRHICLNCTVKSKEVRKSKQ